MYCVLVYVCMYICMYVCMYVHCTVQISEKMMCITLYMLLDMVGFAIDYLRVSGVCIFFILERRMRIYYVPLG
ncbi:hypothetical protein BDV41DRAFT_533227 [Aspergillus transmontanensis]|uniref:Uncharacterized protein n=1 Tax=Aspergillus transmontanensis TaxID=1034304 RepID=A0A5N6W247_9EURO|nr:hypothetical protein BDV41DRAFT_533227 [Aspergillus transmontanensis]